MTQIKNDNRMGWIRNLEKLSKKETNSYFVEYEIATECHIAGVLDYSNGIILCGGLTIEKDENGLYHYLLKVKYAGVEEPYYNNKANKKGYYFKDGILGELLSIFSLYFQSMSLLFDSNFYRRINQSWIKNKNGKQVHL